MIANMRRFIFDSGWWGYDVRGRSAAADHYVGSRRRFWLSPAAEAVEVADQPLHAADVSADRRQCFGRRNGTLAASNFDCSVKRLRIELGELRHLIHQPDVVSLRRDAVQPTDGAKDHHLSLIHISEPTR